MKPNEYCAVYTVNLVEAQCYRFNILVACLMTFSGKSGSSRICSWQFLQPLLPAKCSCIFPFTHSLRTSNRICSNRTRIRALLWPTGFSINLIFPLCPPCAAKCWNVYLSVCQRSKICYFRVVIFSLNWL